MSELLQRVKAYKLLNDNIKNINLCEKIGLPLDDFTLLSLDAMGEISEELWL